MRHASLEWNYNSKHESPFNGFYFSCNGYGHKVVNCELYTRRSYGYAKYIIKCWICNNPRYKSWDYRSAKKCHPSIN